MVIRIQMVLVLGEGIKAPCNKNGKSKFMVVPIAAFNPTIEWIQRVSHYKHLYSQITPDKGRQGLITKWDEKNAAGFGMFIDEQAIYHAKSEMEPVK